MCNLVRQAERCARQTYRDGVAAPQQLNLIRRRGHDMIDASRAQLHAEARAVQWFEFIDVNFQRKAQFFRSFENAPRLIEVKRAVFAEDIAKEG